MSINNQPPIQQVYVQLAPRQPTNGLAIAGLVTGIVGAALSLIPLLGLFLCWLPTLLAIIFGSRSVPRSARGSAGTNPWRPSSWDLFQSLSLSCTS